MNFNLLRACFWLLAAIIGVEMLSTLAAVASCIWLVVAGRLAEPAGACRDISAQVREVWAESLAAILALMLAGRGTPPPPPSS